MRPKMLSLLLALCLLTLPARTYAQGSGVSGFNDDEAKAINKALAELEGRRAEVAALKDLVGAKDRQIASLESLIAAQAKLVEQWRAAAEARHDANDSDAAIKASYEASVKAYEKELAETRADRDRWRSRFKLGVIWGAVGGAVLTVLAIGAANN